MTAAFYESGPVTIFHGDCIQVMRELADDSVHAVVTDPPYGLSDPKYVIDALLHWTQGDRDYIPAASGGFMGKSWDAFVPPPSVWEECLRVLKPGGFLLAFAGSRTHDLMSLSIRLAGFEIRDSIAWLYGSGFPKSLDVAKAIDKELGAERSKVRVDASEVRNPKTAGGGRDGTEGATRPWIEKALEVGYHEKDSDVPATDEASAWAGWETALKPAFEPIVMARKPLAGTVASNVLAHRTGALNVDATRVPFANAADERESKDKNRHADFGSEVGGNAVYGDYSATDPRNYDAAGRWPTNVLLDDSQAALLDASSPAGAPGASPATRSGLGFGSTSLGTAGSRIEMPGGGPSRFFPTFRYEAKAGAAERPESGGVQHPTVKPLDLMRWLVRLVTPPQGVVLEPFAGSGTTVEAAVLEGFGCVAIEREADYLPLIVQRLDKPLQQSLFGDWDGAS